MLRGIGQSHVVDYPAHSTSLVAKMHMSNLRFLPSSNPNRAESTQPGRFVLRVGNCNPLELYEELRRGPDFPIFQYFSSAKIVS